MARNENRGDFSSRASKKWSELNSLTWEQIRKPGIAIGAVLSIVGTVLSWGWAVVAGITLLVCILIQMLTQRQTERVTSLSEEGYLDERTEEYLGIQRRSDVVYDRSDAFSDAPDERNREV